MLFMLKILRSTLFNILFFLPFLLMGQGKTPVEILHANELEFQKIGNETIKKVKGNVRLKQNETLMFCDSALIYDKTNTVDAFGNVRIIQGDSLFIYGQTLNYQGNQRQASLKGGVILKDGDMQLQTEQLNYDLDKKIATYFNGAEIFNGDTELTSQIGYYYSDTKNANFRKNVVLSNPQYTLTSDTLMYNIDSRIAYFFGPTHITAENNYIYTEDGWYNTTNDVAFFKKNVLMQNPPQSIVADSIYYNRNTGIGNAYSNVVVVDTAQNLIIESNRADYFEKENLVVATEKAVMTNIISGDSLYLAADTLRSYQDTITGNQFLFAYHNVKIFKSDLQGACDSLTYNDQDSILRMYTNPVLWSDSNQFSADTINIALVDGKINQLKLINNSFLASKSDTLIYNQIKGRYIDGYFVDDTLRTILVNGNGEAVYYLLDAQNAYIGVNKTECGNMNIRLKDNKVGKIKCTETPSGKVSPFQRINPANFLLNGFVWQEFRKPNSKTDLLKDNDIVSAAEPHTSGK